MFCFVLIENIWNKGIYGSIKLFACAIYYLRILPCPQFCPGLEWEHLGVWFGQNPNCGPDLLEHSSSAKELEAGCITAAENSPDWVGLELAWPVTIHTPSSTPSALAEDSSSEGTSLSWWLAPKGLIPVLAWGYYKLAESAWESGSHQWLQYQVKTKHSLVFRAYCFCDITFLSFQCPLVCMVKDLDGLMQ